MGALYVTNRGSHAQATNADSITIDVPANRTVKIHHVEVTGMASAPAAGAEIGVFRTTANGSGGTPTSLPLKQVDPNMPNPPSGFTSKFGYTSAPTVETDPVRRMAYQPCGGKARYTPMPGGELSFYATAAYQISIRGLSGTPNVAIDEVLLELV